MVKGADEMPCYVPGQVELTPKQSPTENGKFYEVTVYSGTQVSALRSSMVKIGKARYNFSVTYINDRFVFGNTLLQFQNCSEACLPARVEFRFGNTCSPTQIPMQIFFHYVSNINENSSTSIIIYNTKYVMTVV